MLYLLNSQVAIRSAEIFNVRYDKGLQVKYAVRDEDQLTETEMVKGTLKPQFNHNRVVTFSMVKPEHLEFFETGFITFFVSGKQVDMPPDKRLMKMTTKVSIQHVVFKNIPLIYRHLHTVF